MPAAAILMTAHAELEKLVSTIHQNEFKHALDRKWAYLTYAGLWLEPLRADLDAYMDSANETVTGEVTIRLFKGTAAPVARSSPYALYDRAGRLRRAGGGSPRRQAPASSSCSRSRAGWRTGCAARSRMGRVEP